VIAANRDEFLDRPAEPPALREGVGGPLVAPRDLRAGGTWLGLNASGLFVGITNRPTASPDPARRSRGLLVIDSLAEPSARAAAEAAAALPHRAYNPFNLLLADGDEAFAVVYEDAPDVRPLAPGVHVVGNVDPDSRATPKVARLLDAAERVAAAPPDEVLDGLAELCRSHERAAAGHSSREDACIHLGGYGTRGSTLLRIAPGPARGALWYADGPPCSTRYEDHSFLLHRLGRRARTAPGEHAARTTR
jgi:uncharacterized protein with NRDE domain